MTRSALRLAGLLAPLLLAACGGGGQQHTVQVLDDRLQALLARDVASGRATLQRTSDGARVTLLDPGLLPNKADALDNRESDIRASVVEGLLDPALMRIEVADSSAFPDSQRDTRVRNTVQYLTAYGLGPSLQPGEAPQPVQPAQAGAAASGLTISIGVQCPRYHDSFGYGYGSGARRPTCD